MLSRAWKNLKEHERAKDLTNRGAPLLERMRQEDHLSD